MKLSSRGILTSAFIVALAFLTLVPAPTLAQNASARDQWIHVRVESKDDGGETVRVNEPVEMAEKILPVINHENLHNGKVHIDCAHMEDVDLRALLDAVRS